MGLFDRFRRAPKGMVKVPEGHKVVTVGPGPEPCVARIESGAVIADFGPQLASAAVFDAVERRLREQPQVMVVWVIGAPALSLLLRELPLLASWLRRFHAVSSLRGPGVRGDVVVVPASAGPQARALMALLWALDIGAHESAPDGVAFIEVHRPDGITVGMAGSAYAGEEALRGRLRSDYDRLAALAGTEGVADDEARVLRANVIELIQAQQWHAGIRPGAALPTPLSDALTRALHDPTGAAMKAFAQAFLTAKVGVIAHGLPQGAERVQRSTREQPLELTRGTAPDGRTVLLACADREAFVQRFNPSYNAEMLGRDVARTALHNPACEGVLINSAASEHSILFDRGQLAAMLESA